MADWNTPTLSSLYTDFLSYMKDRDVDIAKQFDGTTSTNLPTGAIKWNSTSNRWNKWDGSAWQELATSYGFNSVTLPNGTANGVAYLNGSKVLTTGGALTFDGSSVFSAPRVRLANASRLDWGAGTEYIVGDNGGATLFGVANAEQMRLTSTGLGIGTSSPGNKFVVSASGAQGLEVNPNVSGTTEILAYNRSGSAWNPLKIITSTFRVNISGGGSDALTLDSSGNLGLGVTPSAWGGLGGGQIESNYATLSGRSQTYTTLNAYYNSGWKYIGSASATLYAQASGQHQFYTAPSGTAGSAISFTQAMTLDASGNLGVGTSSPGVKMHIVSDNPLRFGNAAQTGQAQFDFLDSGATLSLYNFYGTGSNLVFKTNPNGGGAVERMRIDSSGNVIVTSGSTWATSAGGLQFAINGNDGYITTYYDTHTVTLGAGVSSKNQIKVSGSGGSNNITMNVGGSERMRIDSSGNLLVGTTSHLYANTSRLNVKGVAAQYGATVSSISGGYPSIIFINEETSGTRYLADFRLNANGSTGVGSITSTGSSTAYNTTSDYRLKENIQPMQNALGVVAQLNPVTYTWKADGSDGQGFIAHELQAVVPDCVTGEKDAVDAEGKPVYQGIDTSFLVATLTKAIQELKAELDATKAEVAALKQGA